jgi:hypothetical protein
MSRLEDRLRDAYRSAADTVTPGAIRGLNEAAPPRSRPARMVPLCAAVVVTVIAVLAAVIVPRATDQARNEPTHGAASAPGPKFLIDDSSGVFPLEVRNAATGAPVAQVAMPAGTPSQGVRTYITSVATADGRNYLVAFYRNPCRSWVYKFQLNGRLVGYTTTACMGEKPAPPSYLAVTNLRTGKTTQWTMPARSSANNVSLTADGRLLCYSLQEGPSMVGVIPTGAAPGSAADRGRTVVRADQFGPSEWISYAAISPDGQAVYFTTYPVAGNGPWAGQVRVEDLATGRSRVIRAPAGQPGLITADPSVQYFLLQIQARATSSLKLARLDLATGTVTYLPSAWMGSMGAVITW